MGTRAFRHDALTLEQEPLFPIIERGAVNGFVDQKVGEAAQPVVEVLQPER